MLGSKKDLMETDLYETLKEHKCESLSERMDILWKEEQKQKSTKKSNPSLLKVILMCFKGELILQGFLIGFYQLGVR